MGECNADISISEAECLCESCRRLARQRVRLETGEACRTLSLGHQGVLPWTNPSSFLRALAFLVRWRGQIRTLHGWDGSEGREIFTVVLDIWVRSATHVRKSLSLCNQRCGQRFSQLLFVTTGVDVLLIQLNIVLE